METLVIRKMKLKARSTYMNAQLVPTVDTLADIGVGQGGLVPVSALDFTEVVASTRSRDVGLQTVLFDDIGGVSHCYMFHQLTGKTSRYGFCRLVKGSRTNLAYSEPWTTDPEKWKSNGSSGLNFALFEEAPLQPARTAAGTKHGLALPSNPSAGPASKRRVAGYGSAQEPILLNDGDEQPGVPQAKGKEPRMAQLPHDSEADLRKLIGRSAQFSSSAEAREWYYKHPGFANFDASSYPQAIRAIFKDDGMVRDLHRLKASPVTGYLDNGCLNDTVVNAYFDLLSRSQKESTGHQPTLFANTYFEPRFMLSPQATLQDMHGSFIGFGKQSSLESYSRIIIPIHRRGHWSLFVVLKTNKVRRLEHWDSLLARNLHQIAAQQMAQRLAVFLEREDRRELPHTSGPWNQVTFESGLRTPQQENDVDCGVFMLTTAKQLSRLGPAQDDAEVYRFNEAKELTMINKEHQHAFAFKQQHMEVLRRCILWELLHQKLEPYQIWV